MIQHGKKILRLAVLLAALPPLAFSASQEITPDVIRAQYILKMRSFIRLGNAAHELKTICYYERPDVPPDESVGQLAARFARDIPTKPGKEPITVKSFRSIRNFNGCDVFFIPADEDGNIDNILKALGASETLTISDAKRFIHRGGMIGFVLDDNNRVKMEASVKNMKKNNVGLAASLLELMVYVEQ